MYSNVLDYWAQNLGTVIDKLWETLFLFSISWAIAIVVGMAIAIFATRPGREKAKTLTLSITSTAQAVPSVAVLALTFIFVGIGAKPALIALFLYSLVPIVFNAASGLTNVSSGIKEAAR
ncbi:MAG: ABC transporter permease, partial [Thermotogota bacterium]|nr:ABC transporter permease [Thermotogota bacterium]